MALEINLYSIVLSKLLSNTFFVVISKEGPPRLPNFGLPIVATNCNEMSNFIEANECGIVCKDDGQSLANALNLLSNDIDKLKQLSCQAERTITNGNLWEDRVKLVARVLEGLGSS